jgi:hypothetical protein
MTLSALKRLAALAEGGATIVGMKPASSPEPVRRRMPPNGRALAAKLWAGGEALTQAGQGPSHRLARH